MKRKMFMILTILMFILMIGCNDTKTKVKLLLPSGTPLIAIGDLLDNEIFEIEIVNGQDPLNAALVKSDYDLIIAPINLGTKLFINGSSSYKLDSIITTNNTYIISKNSLNINDLNNNNILAYGVGSSPFLAMNRFIQKNSLHLEVESLSSVSDVTMMFLSNSNHYAYLSSEPNITTLRVEKKQEFNVIDISKEINTLIIQACLFVNPNSKDISEALKMIEDNITKMNQEPREYAKKIVEKNDFFRNLGQNVLEETIPNCNITYLKASQNIDLFIDYYKNFFKLDRTINYGAFFN